MPEIHPFLPANPTGKWYENNNLHLGVPQPIPDWFVNDNSFAFMPSNEVCSLFLGTFPTYEVVNQLRTGGNTEFFYGQRGNSFWSILELLSGCPSLTENDQFRLLHETGFGLTDILKETNRNGTKSGDVDLLQPWVFNNIPNLKKHFQHICKIYCTSGGKGRVTPGSSVNAARWLLNSFLDLGFEVTGFNTDGYIKHITVNSGNLVDWKFELYNLISPSDNANSGLQGQINRDPQLLQIITNLPEEFIAYGAPMKLRIAQWSFLLSLGGFQLVPSLQAYVFANRDILSLKFQ